MSDASDPADGELIGPYRLVRRLGGGGMGVVFVADDTGLQRQVALKVISPHLAEDPAFRARFTGEAQALAALDSPHVVHVYAHGEDDGRLWIATQLAPDGDLGQMLQDHGAPPARVALDLMAQVAAGLQDAHAAGIVHRDLKPANVVLRRLDTEMRAYLTDFGIARQVGADPTLTGGTVGTPSYMAPELHTGGTPGVASDVYSLGCVLWATLTGHAPYAGGSDYQVVQAHLEQPVPQLDAESALDVEANRILRRAMAKDPADRYDSAAALCDDLRGSRILREDPMQPSRARSRARPALLVASAAGAVVVVVAGVVLALTSGDDTEPTSAPAPTSSPSGPTPTSPPQGDEDDVAMATLSLTRALIEQGVLTPEQAACTAATWIEVAGLDAMVEAGFFDDELNYVDQDQGDMTRRIREAANTAAVSCASPSEDPSAS